MLSLLCELLTGHREHEDWRSGIETRDHLELVLIRCARCGVGLRWQMASRVPDALIISD